MARQYHRQSGSPERYKTISFYRSYHGATMGALTSTGWPQLRAPYEPFLSGGIHCHPPIPGSCRACTGTCTLGCLAQLRDVDRAGRPADGLGDHRRAGDADGRRARALGRDYLRGLRGALRRDGRAAHLRRDRDRVRAPRGLVRRRAGRCLAGHPLRGQGAHERLCATLGRAAHRGRGPRLLGERCRGRPVPGRSHVRGQPRLRRVRSRRDPLLRSPRRARQRPGPRRRARGPAARDLRGATPSPASCAGAGCSTASTSSTRRPAARSLPRSRSAPPSSRRRGGGGSSSAPRPTTRRSPRRSSSRRPRSIEIADIFEESVAEVNEQVVSGAGVDLDVAFGL